MNPKGVIHDSQMEFFRSPFGAVCCNEELLLRLKFEEPTEPEDVVQALVRHQVDSVMGNHELAAVSALRLICASTLGVALTITTRPSDLVEVLEWLLSPLARLGIPVERVAMQIALMLRFTEHFFVQWKKLDDAHRLRTGKSGGLRLIAPLTIHMLQATRRVADALWARLGF